MSKVRRWSRSLSKERFPTPLTPLGWTSLEDSLTLNLKSLSEVLGTRNHRAEHVVRLIESQVYSAEPFFNSLVSLLPRPAWIFKNLKIFTSVFGYLLGHPSLLWRLPRHLARYKKSQLPLLGIDVHDPVFGFFTLLLNKFALGRGEVVAEEWGKNFGHWHKQLAQSAIDFRSLPASPTHADILVLIENMELRLHEFMRLDFLLYFLKTTLFWFATEFIRFVDYQSHGTVSSKDRAETKAAGLVLGLGQHPNERMRAQIVTAARNKNQEQLLQWFKDEYGHLTENWDIAARTLAESDLLSSAWIKASLEDSSQQKFLALGVERQLLEQKHTAFCNTHNLTVWHRTLRLLPELAVGDEQHRFYVSTQVPTLRRLLAMLEKHWSTGYPQLWHGWIYFLTLSELKANLRSEVLPKLDVEVITARHNRWLAALAHDAPENRDYQTLAPVVETRVSANWLQGVGVSEGEAQGILRIVTSAEDFAKLTGSEIALVVRPDPIYSIYHSRCVGMISITGGVMSHGALLAREQGIPMVICSNSNNWLEWQNCWVKLDGKLGVVQKIDSPKK